MSNAAMVQKWSLDVVIDPDTGCWLQTYGVDKTEQRYSRRNYRGQRHAVHRVFYEHFNGPIPEGWTVDHLCRVPRCCNPTHLEAVTERTNLLRGNGDPARNARKTHCEHGHEFTPANTIMRPQGWRACRACKNAAMRRWWHRRKERA